MKQYNDLLIKILADGTIKEPARENMPKTYSLFGEMLKFDLNKGFPLVTTKEVNFKNIVVELLWMLKGRTDLNYLVQNGCNIWNEDFYNYFYRKSLENPEHIHFDIKEMIQSAKSEYLIYGGPIYGHQWRNLPGNDQILNLINGLIENPNSRRHIVECWNVSDLSNMALPPCHKGFQMNVRKNKLDCKVEMSSADFFLGVPYNIASYALLTHIIAFYCNLQVGNLIMSFGDVHIYKNHVKAAQEQILRAPKELPTLKMEFQNKDSLWLKNITPNDFIMLLQIEDFTLLNYNPHPKIKAKLSTGLK